MITGRKNFEAQGRPLPGRTNIIVTRSKDLKIEGCVVVNSIQEGLDYARAQGETEAFITGGGQIYQEGLAFADKIYLTEVDFEDQGEVFFPEFDETKYEKDLVRAEDISEKNKLAWKAFLYTRK